MRFRKKIPFLRNYIMRLLESPANGYNQRIYNNLRNSYKYIRKGDVVLVEGSSKLSRIIKFLSNSHWSHIAMYVGDELIKKRQPLREKYLKEFGEDARHLIIEAFTDKGVIVSPLRKYQDHNIRVCRPFGISSQDLQTVIADVISNLGKQYDQKNIIDIALMLLPSWMSPFNKRSITACIGNCNEFQVICSGMIALAFHRLGYPIVPGLNPSDEGRKAFKKNPYGAKLVMRHYSQVLPRDFDLSSNFEVIKFNIIESGSFNYKSLPWDKVPANGEKQKIDSN